LTNPSILETLDACTNFIGEEMKREAREWTMPCWCPPMMRRMGEQDEEGGCDMPLFSVASIVFPLGMMLARVIAGFMR
jgi:hypothetical protein